MQQEEFAAKEPLRGVIVAFHGLNLDPAQMDELCLDLAEAGYTVYQTALSGHRPGGTHINAVDVDLWQEEAKLAYTKAQKAAQQAHVPFYCLGYSMGAVFGSLAALERNLGSVNGFIFLSPAFETQIFLTPWLIMKRIPKFLATSISIPKYRYNSRLGLPPYLAVHKAIQRLKPRLGELMKARSLVAYDLDDEVANPRFVEALRPRATNWTFFELKGRSPDTPYHHLTINSEVLGPEVYQNLLAEIRAFLKATGSR